MKKLYFFLILGLGLVTGVSAQIPVDTVTILDWDGNPLTEGFLYINVGETKALQLDIRPANADPETMTFDIEVGDEDEELGYPVTIEGMSATAHRSGTRSLRIYVGQELKAAATLHSTYLKEYVVQAEGAGAVYCTINAQGQLQFWAGAYDHPKPDPAYVAYNIPSFETPESAPWYDDRESIHEVLLDNVDSVGDYAFNNLDGIQSVSFPETFKSLGDYVFLNCHGLNTLEVARYSYEEEPYITATTGTSLITNNSDPDKPVRPNMVIVRGGEAMFEAYRSPDAEWSLCDYMTFTGGGIPGDTSSVHFEITPSEDTEALELTIAHDDEYEKPVVLDDRTEEMEYPWDAVGDQIEDLQVNDRVSYLGSRVFSELTNLQTIQFNQATDPLDSIHVKAFSKSITPWKFALGDPQDGPILPPKIAGDDGKALSQWLHFKSNTVLYVPDSVFEYQGEMVRAVDLYRADPVWGQAFNRITDRTVDTDTSDDEEVVLKWLPLEDAQTYRLVVHKKGCDECEAVFEIPATGKQGLVDWDQLESEQEEENPSGAPRRIRREDEHGGMTLTISIQAGSGVSHNTDVSVSITGMEPNADYTFTREVLKSGGTDMALSKSGSFKIVPKTYTVTFVDKDDVTIKTETVEEGNAATAPTAPEVEGYHFTGWDKTFDNIASDLTVKAQYAINVYTVTFVDKEGNTLKTESVEHGKSATAPEVPEVEGYHFTEWDKKYDKITSDLTVQAQYAINTYMVIFVNWNDEELKSESVEWGKAATAPSDPTREGYTFKGWDKDFSNITADLTVKAQFTINVYTVTFVDKDGNTLKTQSVEHGKSATAPEAPEVEGYHFTEWDKKYDKITSDLTVQAQYVINTYTVTFVNWNDEELKSESVEWGKAATAPSDPTREGYTFKGWDKDFSNITADLTVKAQFTINVYTVTFLDKDGNTLKTEKVKYGKSATAPEAPEVEGWTFAGWDKAFNVVKSDLTVQATYTKNPVYTVTFKDYDGSIIATMQVEEGKSAVKPDDPIREGYTFTGWDKDFSNVTSDLIVTAQYAINVYTVTFVDKDGNTLKTQSVEHGKSATAPEAPEVEGYHFTEWDKKYDKITSDLTVQAQYVINTYTVTFVNWNDEELKSESVEWGKAATAPSDPTREGYTFKSWDKDFSNITADLTVKAQFTINVYTVTFLDKDGNTLKTEKVKYGKSATAPEAPEVEGYTFLGWDKTCDYVTSDLTITAQYLINLYAVTFIGFDGTILRTEQVEHGSAATAPKAPEVEGYTFIGWDKEFDHVTSDLTVTALYEAIPDYTPTNLSVVVEVLGDDDQQITLSWDAVEGAASYDLRLVLGDKELYAGNTFGMHVISLKLSEILQVATIEPDTYPISWFVRSTGDKAQAISEWAQGETFEVTVKEPGQGIEDVNTNANARKEMRNGILYILRGGHMYDTHGKRVE